MSDGPQGSQAKKKGAYNLTRPRINRIFNVKRVAAKCGNPLFSFAFIFGFYCLPFLSAGIFVTPKSTRESAQKITQEC